jgi:hypothetical protein
VVLLLIDSLEEPTSLDATVVGTSAPNRDARYTTSTDVTALRAAKQAARMFRWCTDHLRPPVKAARSLGVVFAAYQRQRAAA